MKKINNLKIGLLFIAFCLGLCSCSSSVPPKEKPVPSTASEWLETEDGFTAELEAMAETFIEEYEGVEVRTKYGCEFTPIDSYTKSTDDKVFKYGFIVSGQYTDKSTNKIGDFVIKLFLKDGEFQKENRTYACLYYRNELSGTAFNAIKQ